MNAPQVCPFCGRLDCDGERAQRHWQWWADEQERRTGRRPMSLSERIDQLRAQARDG